METKYKTYFIVVLMLIGIIFISGCVQQQTTIPSKCISDWQCSIWSECSQSGLQTRTCSDLNDCRRILNKPVELQSCTPPCIPDWQCTKWPQCSPAGIQTRTCSDSNKCGVILDKPTESQSCEYQTLSGPEPIVFAINKNYADKMPDWKNRADRAVNNINNVFLKTTKKEYKILKYIIYEDQDYEKTWYDPNFHVEWNGFGMTTIILLVHKDGISIDELKQITPSNTVNVGMDFTINEVSYHNILIAEHESYNLLLNRGELDNYETVLELTLHELGHTNGLAVPDWYLYSYIDCTDTEPLLPRYEIREVYPEDPMTSSGSNKHQFSELNSKIIDMNLDHKYGYMDINGWFTKTSKVYVTNSNGNPLENAEVRIFCVRKNCFYCNSSCNGESGVVNSNTPEQILYTDNLGYVEYKGPSGKWDFNENENTECLAKAIKVYYQGKSKLQYVNFLDLQEDYILHNLQTHIDHVIID